MIVLECLFYCKRYSFTVNIFVASIISCLGLYSLAALLPYSNLTTPEMMSYTLLLVVAFIIPLTMLGILLYTGWIGHIVKRVDRTITTNLSPNGLSSIHTNNQVITNGYGSGRLRF